MGIWKYPEDVTNERCKVKCPVKSSGDLKQAAFTAAGRFPQTIISGTPRPSARCDYRSVLRGRSLTDVAGKSEAGMTETSPGSPLRHGLASLACYRERSPLHSLQAGAHFQWLNVGRQSAGSPSKPLWIKLMQPGVPLQLGLR